MSPDAYADAEPGEGFAAAAYAADPYPFYAYARATEPVFYSEQFGMWFVTRHDDVLTVLRDPETFSSADRSIKPGGWPEPVAEIMRRKRHARHVGNVDPPEHTRYRQLLNQSFTASRIASYEPMVHDIARELIDALEEAGPGCDLLQSFTYPFPLHVICRIIGIPRADVERCWSWCEQKARIDFAAETLTPKQQVSAAEASVALQDYCDDLVARRTTQPADDLVSHLISTRVRGHEPMTAHEVSDLLPILIFAGHETTANLLGNLIHQLLGEPTELARLRARPDLVPDAVEEGLRHNTPALGFVRRVQRDVDLAGARLTAGSKVFLLFGSGNHDEARWEAGEQFDHPRPRATTHLSFGNGIHFCVGAALARTEARIGLEQLLRRLPSLRFQEDVDSMRWSSNLVLRKLTTLPVTWDRARGTAEADGDDVDNADDGDDGDNPTEHAGAADDNQ